MFSANRMPEPSSLLSCKCPTLPTSSTLQQEFYVKAENELNSGLKISVMNYNSIQSIIGSLYENNQKILCYNILVGLIQERKPNGWNDDIIGKILNVLKACTDASKFHDDNGLFLLHHLVLIDDCPDILIRRVMILYPIASTFLASSSLGIYTPLHLLLLKADINLENVYFMLMTCPQSAKCFTKDGKLPIHFLMNYFPQSPIEVLTYVNVMRKLLSIYPESAFVEIVEEVRTFRFSGWHDGITSVSAEGVYNFVTQHKKCYPFSKSKDIGIKEDHRPLNQINSIRFEELLRAVDVKLPDTPPPRLSSDVELTVDCVQRIYFHVLKKLERNSVAIPETFWFAYFKGALDAGDNVNSNPQKAAFLSLLVAISRSNDPNDFLIPKLFCKCEVSIQSVLPPNVLLFLESNEVRSAFQSATNPNIPLNYPIPPVIYVVSGVSAQLAGWVCFADSIAINSLYFETASSKIFPPHYAEMVLGNVIAHECQHGFLRKQKNDFNLHSSDLQLPAIAANFPGVEAGLCFEYTLWRGIPQWHAPVDIAEAEILAGDIFELLRQGLPLFDPNNDDIFQRLQENVGFDGSVRSSDRATSKFYTRFLR